MMRQIRRDAYRTARGLGNVEAVEHGYKRAGVGGALGGYVKRRGRRCVYRKVNQECSHRLCKTLGLWG